MTHSAMLVMVACPDEDPAPELAAPPNVDVMLAYESEHVEVFTRTGMSFCRGDGARMDAHLARLSADAGLTLAPQIPIYVVKTNDEGVIDEWCFGAGSTLDVEGCFRPWMIVSQRWALTHELNHALVHMLNPGLADASGFWSEAYASAFEYDESGTVYLDGLAEQETAAAYNQGKKLVRWIVGIHGVPAVTAFIATIEPDWNRDDIDLAFADHFGLTYTQALEDYESTAAPLDPGYGWCDGVEVIDVPLGDVHTSLSFDCDAADTFTFTEPAIDGMYVRRVLRLGDPADVQIDFDSPAGILTRHPCVETPVESQDDPRLANSAWYRHASPGAQQTAKVAWLDSVPAGDTLVEFVIPFGEPVSIGVTIHATSPGP